MPAKPWDGGNGVSPRGRFYIPVPVTATLRASVGVPGAAGDELDWLWLFPSSLTPGAVVLSDGAIPVWTWPAGVTLQDTRPIFVPLNLSSRVGPWTLTLAATFSALAAGAFS
jgi:hypothetical protein